MKVLIGFCILAVALAARPEVKKTCAEKPEIGPCFAAFRMWYYDPETATCKRFIYGGCQGNGNRYRSEKECLDNCKAVTQEPEQLSDHQEVDCNALPDPGLCQALIPRYYYDPLDAQCKTFMYGGCMGNSNNFKTAEECNKKCGESDDDDVFDALSLPFSCDCEGGNSTCSCCGTISIPRTTIEHKVCVEIGYNDEKGALTVAIKANNKNIYSNEISTRNPPPICVSWPPMGFVVDVCFDFYKIKVSTEKIDYCLNIKPRIIRREITDVAVGCYHFNRIQIETSY